MMNNRRNYYRILHVQPEAPDEIIKASYRSLMTKLKMHPDLGGSHDTAVLINQAYAVLSDPQRRKKYDETLNSRATQTFSRRPYESPFAKAGWSTPGDNGGYRASREYDKSASMRKKCFFCETEHAIQAAKYCNNCASPLTPTQSFSNSRFCELFGRRTSPRINKVGSLTIYPSWPHEGCPGRLSDLSTSGLSMVTQYQAKIGQVIKFDSSFFKGVARVVTVRPTGTCFSVHLAFLATEFITKSGVFVTEKA